MAFLNEARQRGSGLEQLQRMLERDQRPGMAHTLGVRLVDIREGEVTVDGIPGEEHYNPLGAVQGGYAATLLDFACGYATLSLLPEGTAFGTLELKVSYHRPLTAATGAVRATAKILTLGRRTAFAEARLVDGEGRLYASASSTLLITGGG